MASVLDFPARGKILRVEGNLVVFNPLNTTYELQLVNKGQGTVAVSSSAVQCHIRVAGRKIMTMGAGGNFITPIFGPPKVVQGRVRYLDEKVMVVQAGCPVIVTLPTSGDAFDLINGPVSLGQMLNATLLQGATFELAEAPQAV